MGQYSWDSIGDIDGKGWLLGGLFPIGAGEIRLAYSQYKVEASGSDPKSKQVGAGLCAQPVQAHGLYTTYAHVKNRTVLPATAAPGAAGIPASTRTPAASTSAFATASDHGRP